MGYENLIYKICPFSEWRAAEVQGQFRGSAIDLEDGYIHFSTALQAGETLAKHFRGQNDLVLIEVASTPLGPALKWEPSRGGDLFPHLYAPLPVAAALSVTPLRMNADGSHEMPDLVGKAPDGRKSAS